MKIYDTKHEFIIIRLGDVDVWHENMRHVQQWVVLFEDRNFREVGSIEIIDRVLWCIRAKL